jgi:hypothetical protein
MSLALSPPRASGTIAQAKDTLFVVSAGNGLARRGYDLDVHSLYPPAYQTENMIVVTATDNRT